MTPAYSYIRWSSDKQNLGDSERRQVDAAAAYCKAHSLTLASTRYTDAGISAFKGLNAAEGALKAFIDAVDAKTIPVGSVLIVESLDRLSRLPVTKALRLFQDIVESGIEIVTLNDNQRYSQDRIDANWTSLIIALAVMSRANEESKTKSKRVKEAWDNKRKSGAPMTGMAPAWLRLSDDRKKWGVIKEQADKVREIFRLSRMGNGAPTIARILNDKDVLPFRSEFWTNGTVQHVLGNRAVIGVFVPKNGELPVEGYFPAIVDEGDFWSVQDGMRSRKWKGSSNEKAVTNLFTGLCHCHCGRRMRFVASAKPRYYLHCSSAYSRGGCSGEHHPYRDVSSEGLERYILVWFHLDMELTYLHMEAGKSDVAGKTVLEGQLSIKQQQLDQMIELMKAGSKRGAHEVMKLEADVEALTTQLRNWALPASQTAIDQFNESFLLLQDMNREKDFDTRNDMRRAMRGSLQRLVEQIVFLDGTHEKEERQWKTVLIQLKGQDAQHRVEYPLPR